MESKLFKFHLFKKMKFLYYRKISKECFKELLQAIESKDCVSIELILQYKLTNPNRRNRDCATPLMLAAGKANSGAVKILLEYGADPNLTDKDGWSAKTWAIFRGDQETIKHFQGLSIFSTSRKGFSNSIMGLFPAKL